MQPAPAARRLGDRGHGVDRGRRGGADRRHDRGRVGEVAQVVRACGTRSRTRPCAPRGRASGRPCRPTSARARSTTTTSRPVASRAAISAASVEVEALSSMWPCQPPGSPSRSADPVEHDALELGGGRRGAPQDRHRVERRRQQLGQDRRLRGAGGEVGEVARMLPVGDAGQQDLVEIAQHRSERLWLLGRPRAAGRGSLPAPPARARAARRPARGTAAHSSAAAPSLRRSVHSARSLRELVADARQLLGYPPQPSPGILVVCPPSRG